MDSTLDKPRGQAVAERRQRLKAMGLCIDCGKRPATAGPRGGMRLCDICREIHAKSAVKGPKPRPYREMTPAQKRSRNTSVTQYRDNLREKGLCIRCGKNQAEKGPQGGSLHCISCQQKRQQQEAKRNRKSPLHLYALRAVEWDTAIETKDQALARIVKVAESELDRIAREQGE